MQGAYLGSVCSTPWFVYMCSPSVVLLARPSNSRVVDACGPKLIPCHTDRNCMVTELSGPSCRAVSRRREVKTALNDNERFASVKCVGKEVETLNGLLTGPHQNQQVRLMQSLRILRELMSQLAIGGRCSNLIA
jgi:hypothetical protein